MSCLPILHYEVVTITLTLTSAVPPSVNHYLGHRAVLRNGKPISVSYCTNEAQKYKKEFSSYVAEESERQGWVKPAKTQHVYVDAVFYFPREDMDANNYWKCMLDAITDTGVVWEDDNIVCERVQGIYYDTNNPRVELCIRPVQYIGIFQDMAHLEDFENRCIGCTRYKRNCSILRNAKAGKVQSEISGSDNCQKYKACANKE